jgi:hypothetical protein
MIINPQLGTAQDDFLMIRTLQSGLPFLYYSSWFPYYSLLLMGRFTPLSPMEYNLFGLFMKSPSAFWYFLFHAFEYVLMMIVFVKILSRFTANKFLIYITPILLSLTPDVIIPFFRTHITDKHMFLFYGIFLFFFFLYLEKPKLRYLILGITSINMALYYKEMSFIIPSAFVFFYLLLTWKKSKLGVNPVRSSADFSGSSKDGNEFAYGSDFSMKPDLLKTSNGVKIFCGLVLLSSLIFLLIYYFYVYLRLDPNIPLYGQTSSNPFTDLIKNILNYGFATDPIVIFILLPFVAWRLYKFLRRKIELLPIQDSMLLAGSALILGYLVTNRYSPNYMLPVYVLVLPPLIYFFSQKEQRTFYFKGAAIVCGLIILLNVFPAGIYQLTYYKYFPVNYNKMLDFMVKDINSRYPNKRANIFLYGIEPKGGGGIYYMDSEFLQYKGLTWDRFDLRANEKIEDNTLLSFKDFNPPFSVFQNKFYDIQKGDYLIISPRNTKINIDRNFVHTKFSDYDLIFETKSPLAFPDISLKTLVKYFLSGRIAMLNQNLMNWPDYYVLIKK